MNKVCAVCNDAHYLICERDDGCDAVERCDACSDNFSDEEAAVWARIDGVKCALRYPCYVVDGYGV